MIEDMIFHLYQFFGLSFVFLDMFVFVLFMFMKGYIFFFLLK